MSESNESRPARSRVVLRNISSRAWEHPADRGALVALRKLKGFDTAVKLLSSLFNERAVRLLFFAPAIRVEERHSPELHRALNDAASILDAPVVPELYVQADPGFNAMTIGLDRPIIVINSGMVDLLDEDELRWILAHELGHALSGHAVYRTILLRLMNMSGVFYAVPLGGLGLRMIIAGLMEWRRKTEVSAHPGRPPRPPGPRHVVPRADEAGQRRWSRGPRPDLVLRAGHRVRSGHRPARLRAQAAAARASQPPHDRLPSERAAAMGRQRRVHRDPRRRVPHARHRRRREGQRGGPGSRAQLLRCLPRHPGHPRAPGPRHRRLGRQCPHLARRPMAGPRRRGRVVTPEG